MTETQLSDLSYSSATQKLIDHWLKLPRKHGQTVPHRSSLNIEDLADIKDELFFSEWYSDQVLTIIESGKTLQRWLGIDLKGHNILALFSPETAEEEQKHYRHIRTQPCAGLITRQGVDVAGTPIIYRTLQLPLLDTFDQVRFFIGTGAALEEPETGHKYESTYFSSVQDVERRYFDIGAGLPHSAVP